MLKMILFLIQAILSMTNEGFGNKNWWDTYPLGYPYSYPFGSLNSDFWGNRIGGPFSGSGSFSRTSSINRTRSIGGGSSMDF